MELSKAHFDKKILQKAFGVIYTHFQKESMVKSMNEEI